MYIEFSLPPGPAAFVACEQILQHIEQWSQAHYIPYRSKAIKRSIRLTFDQDQYYSFFMMSWRPPKDRSSLITDQSFWQNFRLITDLNNKT